MSKNLISKNKLNHSHYRKWLINKTSTSNFDLKYSSKKNKELELEYVQFYKENPMEVYVLLCDKKKKEKLEKRTQNIFLYLIGSGQMNLCKIGYSISPLERLSSIQTGFPYKLEIIDLFQINSIKEEKVAHKLFKNHRLQGEWFTLNNEILEYFKSKKTYAS